MLDVHGRDLRAARSGMPAQFPTLHIAVVRNRATPIVTLAGEVDLVDKQKLDDCLASLTGTVIVDLRGVTFLGSTGLRAFVVAQKHLDDDGGRLFAACSSRARPSRARDHRARLHGDRDGSRRRPPAA